MNSILLPHPEPRYPEIDIQYSQEVTPQINWFISGLKGMIADGSVFQAEETLQMASSIFKFSSATPGKLILCEPDYSSFPIQFVAGVSQSLSNTLLQKYFAESYGFSNLDPPSLLSSLLCCSEIKNQSELFLDRSQPNERDSGWFVGCLQEDHDHNDAENLKRVSIYETILMTKSKITPWLAFPAGISIWIEEGKVPFVSENDVEIPVIEKSYVWEKFRGV